MLVRILDMVKPKISKRHKRRLIQQGLIKIQSSQVDIDCRPILKTQETTVQNNEEFNQPNSSHSIPGPETQSEVVQLDPSFPEFVSDCDHLYTGNNNNTSSIKIQTFLTSWSLKHNIPHNAISELLKQLKSHKPCFSELPVDARTLLKTPRSTVIRSVPPGEYYHFGLVNGILNTLRNYCNRIKGKVLLQVNVDGIPLHKSTSSQFWGILGYVVGSNSPPFVIGVYYGSQKPKSPNDFLKDFVNELLVSETIAYDDHTVEVELQSFICDAPARAFISQIKGHTGFYGCGKCTIRGETYLQRVIFNGSADPLRTNSSFRNRTHDGHHIGDSDLEKLDIDLVKCFPFESMHLVYLGVVRKLVRLWLRGKIGVFRVSSANVEILSDRLIALSKYIPSDFNRKPRSLREIDRWKASEFRQFLLYSGPVVLKKYIDPVHYSLFLTLSVAIRILSTQDLHLQYNSYADSLLKYFVSKFGVLYGLENLSYNIHGLVHLASDSEYLGPLEKFSGFKFENHLGFIKKTLRSSRQPLQQLHRRLVEHDHNLTPRNNIEVYQYNLLHQKGPLPPECSGPEYKEVLFKTFKIKCTTGENVCLLNNNKAILVENFCKLGEKIVAVGRKFKNQSPMFDKPCDSSILNMYEVYVPNTSSLRCYDLSELAVKCVGIPNPDKHNSFFVLPLVHCFEV